MNREEDIKTLTKPVIGFFKLDKCGGGLKIGLKLIRLINWIKRIKII